ncbi:unnamed protein product [Orchesella dallaii]|uniref:SH3 and multiple ankyrin repeat domains protein 3 n=1 Tax=Orchesella dallaii TaxID=48710 RepID=A0ABP1PYG6_9HEXA
MSYKKDLNFMCTFKIISRFISCIILYICIYSLFFWFYPFWLVSLFTSTVFGCTKVTHWFGELKESFNYGLFAPPCNGKAGKFLDEERPLSDYPFSGPVGYLELRYKRRLYKGINIDEKQLKSLHTKSNLRRFLDYVSSGHCEKITKMCSKGLDPNFHCPETGETPLSMAALMKKPSKLLIALVNGGALLDYRTKDGSTAMHRSVESKNVEAVKTMLDLGGSPNYRDSKGLTPLYISVATGADPTLCEMLLHDHAYIGAQDTQGWHETHQACRNGLVQHLEHLLYYGADMNARNASGNTPLHVCAVNNQESCARLLLFRGADKEALNFANQTPYQVAVIAGNLELAEIIQNHRPQDVEKSLDHSDITSDSSGVGTCNSGGSGSSYDATPTDPALILPGMMVVCVENYTPTSSRHLKLTEGDIIEVTASTGSGVLEGSLRGNIGLFPASCVQEIRMKVYENRNNLSHRTPGSKKDAAAIKHLAKIKKIWGEPHTVILHRGQKGFGFVLRGAKADSPLMELQPSDRFPALQYLDDVDENGVADRAGLRKGDFILTINGVDVSQFSHESVVDLIRKSADLVSMTVVGLSYPQALQQENCKPGSPASLTCDANSSGTPKAQYHFATLPRKYSGSGGPNVPSPPRRDPNTSLSVGRARAKSMVAALADLGDGANHVSSSGENVSTKSSSVDSIAGKPPLPPSVTNSNGTNENGTSNASSNSGVQTKTASIRARPSSGRIAASEIEELFTEKSINGAGETMEGKPTWTPSSTLPHAGHKIYASVAEMKRSKSALKGKELAKLHKDFHSTPDLEGCKKAPVLKPGLPPERKSKSLSQENLNQLRVNPRHSWACMSPTIQGLFDKNYENSWKSIETLPAPPPEAAAPAKEDGHESDSSTGSSTTGSTSGEETPKSIKTPVIVPEGEYRTIKPLRPVQSKTLPRRASTGCTISTAEQQTIMNLVPPGQVIKVDVSKSKDYASLDVGTATLGRRPETGGGVMSSFKPTDSAKLYASPDDLKLIGYRESNQEQISATGTLRKIRSQSLPPGKKEGKSGDYAEPVKGAVKENEQSLPYGNIKPDNSNNGACNDASSPIMPSLDDSSTTSIGTKNMEKKISNITSNNNNINNNIDQKFDPQKSLQEAKDKLKPVKPVLKTTSSLSNSVESTKIRIEVKQSPRLSRKVEKTVTFQSEPSQQSAGTTNAAQTSHMSHSMSVDEIPKVKATLKASKSFPNDLGQEEGEPGTASTTETSETQPGGGGGGTNYVTCLPVNPDSDSSEDSSDKTWILKDENGPSSASTTSDSVQTVISAAQSNSSNQTNHVEPTKEKSSEKVPNTPPQNVPAATKQNLSASVQLGVAHLHQQQLQQLTTTKPQSQNPQVEPNYGTLGRASALRSAGSGPSPGGNLTKNAVSLVKLPPPMEIESETDDSRSPRDTRMQKKTYPYNANEGTHQAYHTLQPQRSKPMHADHQQYQQHMQLQHQYHLQQQQLAARQLQQLQGQGQGQNRQAEKSIEESLKLIQMHVAALKQDFPSVVPPPPEFSLRNQTPILAPPPEFSDARDTHEQATRFNQGHAFAAANAEAGQPNSLPGQQPFNRQSPMYRSITHSHTSSSSMYSGYPTMSRQQYQLHQQHSQLAQQHMQQYQTQQAQLIHAQQQQQQQQSHQQQQQQSHQQQQQQSHQQTQQQHPQQHPQQQQPHPPQQQQQQQAHQQHPPQQQQHQQPQHIMTMSMPAYQSLGRHQTYSTNSAQSMLNSSAYGHYSTLTNPKLQSQSQHQHQQAQTGQQQIHAVATQGTHAVAAGSAAVYQQHHPKCYYYQQTGSSGSTTQGGTNAGAKYIPEKLHPVHRYTPDIYESSSGPRIVGTIPKKQPGSDHYEVPHAHQQLLQQQAAQQQQQQAAQQQQAQQQQTTRIRREFRNKTLPDWSVGDACDWLDSLFMPEYKAIFQQRAIDGKKLMRIDNATLLELGIKKLGHRMNIEKSLKRYLPQPKT